MIRVLVNGREIELAPGATLVALVEALGLVPAQVAAVEHNGEPVARSDQAERRLADGDRIELVRAVAGG